MLRENNARRGFFEPAEFEALRAELSEALRPVVTFAYITGWRVTSEILPLTWTQVDFNAGTVRLASDDRSAVGTDEREGGGRDRPAADRRSGGAGSDSFFH